MTRPNSRPASYQAQIHFIWYSVGGFVLGPYQLSVWTSFPLQPEDGQRSAKRGRRMRSWLVSPQGHKYSPRICCYGCSHGFLVYLSRTKRTRFSRRLQSLHGRFNYNGHPVAILFGGGGSPLLGHRLLAKSTVHCV